MFNTPFAKRQLRALYLLDEVTVMDAQSTYGGGFRVRMRIDGVTEIRTIRARPALAQWKD